MSLIVASPTFRRKSARVPAVEAFSPDSITGLLAWYDPSDISTLWQDAGVTQVASHTDPVAQIDDKSGSVNTMSQTVTSRQPEYRTGTFGSLPSVYAAGAHIMKTPAQVVTDDNFSIFAVVRANPQSNGILLAQHSGVADPGRTTFMGTDYRSPYKVIRWLLNNGTSNIEVLGTSVAFDGSAHLAYSESDGSGRSTTRVDGGPEEGTLTGETWTPLNDPLTLFSITDLLSPYTGHVGEILVYSPALSSTDRQAVEDYLSSKWGTP